MTVSTELLVLPGDGIGPEVIGQCLRVLEALALPVTTTHGLIGGASIDATGQALPEAMLEKAKRVQAVLVGAVGGPKWAGRAFADRPESGLLQLRGGLGVFANLRPARCFAALADASSLKRELVEGLDLLFVRELTGGVYFGEPRGISLVDGERVGVNTHVYSASEIRRVAVAAFELARGRSRRVVSAEKSNVMEAGVLWREEVQDLRDTQFPDIELTHILADNLAMQLVKNPKQFDVILTDNLFGDILSDEAAMLTGSLGMLPSASLGVGAGPGLYEPIHGSAPDIAGQGVANPSAAILSLAMALRFSLGFPAHADRVERAVERALDDGARTRDLGGALSGQEMASAIITRL